MLYMCVYRKGITLCSPPQTHTPSVRLLPLPLPLSHHIEFVAVYSWTISFFDNEKHTDIAVDVLIYFMSLTAAYLVSQKKNRITEHRSHLHYTVNKMCYQFLFNKSEKKTK